MVIFAPFNFTMREFAIAALIVVLAALRVSGVLPFNFSPVAALALFGGAMFAQRWLAFGLPLAVMLISDLFIGFHSSMWAVYGAFGLTVLMGRALANNASVTKTVGVSVLSSLVFFLLTNAAAWIELPEYTKDLSGLMQAYAAGIPFYRNTLAGDVIFTFVLFGSWKLAEVRFPTLARA